MSKTHHARLIYLGPPILRLLLCVCDTFHAVSPVLAEDPTGTVVSSPYVRLKTLVRCVSNPRHL